MDQERLNSLGPRMDPAAARLVRADGNDAPDAFPRAYVLAVAEVRGAEAIDQCTDGEPWAPVGWLRYDEIAVIVARALLEVPLDDTLWADAWERYANPRPEAFDACGLPRRAS